MKTFISTTTLLFISNLIFCQWTTKIINNQIDEPYRIAYCSDTRNSVVLKLEKVGEELSMYIGGGYFCDDNITTNLSFIVNGVPKKYIITGVKSSNSTTLFLVDNLLTEDIDLLSNNPLSIPDLFSDFKSCSKVLIRVNESYCNSDTYTFTMSGSTNAVKFMTKQ